MHHFLVYTNADQEALKTWFNGLNSRFNTAFGYPSEDGRTTHYADPMDHPDRDDSIAIAIEERCLPHLTPEETAALVTETEMRAQGWFPGLEAPRPWWGFLLFWR